MKHRARGFTILEIIIVIIIVGILATLGASQYASTVERSRGAEAQHVCSLVRKLALAHYLEHQSLQTPAFTQDDANIGVNNDQHPRACRQSHYFNYNIAVLADNQIRITARRCRNNGKPPDFPGGCGAPTPTYILTATLDTGINDVDAGMY